jgi:hypothetical protein
MFNLISEIKTSTPLKCKYQIVLIPFLVFVDVGENLIMTDDVTIFESFNCVSRIRRV